MRFLLMALILLASVSATFSQTQHKPHLWAESIEGTVMLRWTFPSDNPLPNDGFTILRKKHGSLVQFQPIATVLPKLESLPNSPERDTLSRLITILTNSSSSTSDKISLGLTLRLLMFSKPTIFFPVLGLQYSDTSARLTNIYDYAVAIGNETIATIENIQPSATSTLAPPEQLIAKPMNNGTRLSWNIAGSFSRGIAGWKVYRRDEINSAFRVVNRPILSLFFDESYPASYLFEDDNLINGKEYEYCITAYSVFGRESQRTQPVRLIPNSTAPLLPPSLVAALSAADSVLIAWLTSIDKRVRGFHVYRGLPQKLPVRITERQLAEKSNRYTDRPKSIPSPTITYSLTSLDSAGNESERSFEHSVPVPDNQPPDAPQFFIAQGEQRRIMLAWSRSRAIDIQGYEIERSTKANGLYSLITGVIADSMFVDSVPAPAGKTAFWYRLRAVDLHGNRSNWTAATLGKIPDVVAPPPPTISSIKNGDRIITLEWQANYDKDIMGYWINRTDDTLFTPITVNQNLLPPTSAYFQDSSAAPGILYFYEVVAMDSAMNYSSPSVRIAGRSYDTRHPVAPHIDTLISSSGGITVAWSWDGKPQAQFELVVERSRDNKRFVQVSPLLDTSITRFTDLSARDNDQYFYRLRIRNQYGNWSEPSGVKMCRLDR
jgi:fibronectin type 3 domain-containing protein